MSFQWDLEVTLRSSFLFANAVAALWLVGRCTTQPPLRALTRDDVHVLVLQVIVSGLLGTAVIASDRVMFAYPVH